MNRILRTVICRFLVTCMTVASGYIQIFPDLPTLTPVYVNQFSAAQGLGQTCASDVLIDRRGRMWVATCSVMAGVNSVRLFQFDGYEFKPINLANDSIPERTVAVFYDVMPDGDILGWFESKDVNTLFFFNPDKQFTTMVAFDAQKEGLLKSVAVQPDGSVLALLMKPDSLLLFRVEKSRRKTLVVSWNIPVLTTFEDISIMRRAALYLSGDDVLVASSYPMGLFQVKLSARSCQNYPMTAPLIPIQGMDREEGLGSDRFSLRFIPMPGGALLCFIPTAEHQVFIRPNESAPFKPMADLPQGYSVHRVEKDSVGNVLFVLKNSKAQYAALLFDREGQRYDYSGFVAGHSDINMVRSSDFFQAVFICAADGLSYKSVREKDIVHCTLSGYSIRAMVEPESGAFFISTQNKTSVLLHGATGKIKTLAPDHPLIKAFGSGMVTDFEQAPDGAVWGIRSSDTLVQYFPLSGTHHDYPGCRVEHFCLLSDKRVAVYAKLQGVCLLDPLSGQYNSIKNGAQLQNFKGIVNGMKQTRDGTLWVLTTNGLWKIDLNKGIQKRLGFEPPFRDFRFLCMTEAEDGKLWLGTFLGGVHIYDPRNGTVKIVDKNRGLPNNTVASITRDDAGNFWAATYKGLSELAPDGTVKGNLFGEEGLCELEFNRFANLKAKNGSLLLGTVEGLHIVQPPGLESAPKTVAPPQIYLTSLMAANTQNGAERNDQFGFEEIPELELAPDRRRLSLRFALSNYIQPNRNQFAYRFEGIDPNWIPIGNQHELTLNDLPAGRYTLLIKGCDFQGNWTETPIRISIYAREFFYKQPWFYFLCLLPFLIFGWIWLQQLRSEKSRLEQEVRKRTHQIQEDKVLIEQQAQELMRLDEAKSRFFTNISHELRTPITLITAPIEQLLRKDTDHSERATQQSLQWVLHNGRKLAALVEELLELSRLEAGKTVLQETPTEFYPYCRQLFSAFESQAHIKRIRYKFNYQGNTHYNFMLDRRRLEKIINNLLSNALKFTPPEGLVEMNVRIESLQDAAKHLISIQVKDTGRGIPPDDLPHLFERYFQTNHHHFASEGGTGIGLALAKELSALMHGNLQVESSLGAGSRFTLTLAATEAPALSGPTPQTVPDKGDEMPTQDLRTATAPMDAPHILLVEDNPDMQALLRTILGAHYKLSIANNGQEAWDLLENPSEAFKDLSLILSDVMMPRMDGYALLEKIKNHPRQQYLPIVMLTARAEENSKLQALRFGVDDYLIKPFSPQELLARLHNLIQNYQKRKAFSSKITPDISFDEVDTHDHQWLKTIETAAKTALDKGLSLNVPLLAEAGAMSERQFFREIKRLTGLTPNGYILEVRLQKARHLLQHRAYGTLAEYAYAVGFETPAYFTKVFEKHFGKHPSAYLEIAGAAEPLS
ncbi:MAG: ATP-binding protein [Bacteroidota bacterium]